MPLTSGLTSSLTRGLTQDLFKTPPSTTVTPLLDVDGMATAAAGYSVRKLRAAYTGKALKVRRASDSDEADVAFDTVGQVSSSSVITVTSGDYSGTMTLGDFLSGTTGSVTTWYDQVGSNNATQGVGTKQPQLKTDGSATVGDKAELYFDSISGDFLSSNYQHDNTDDTRTQLVVTEINSSAHSTDIYGLLGNRYYSANGTELYYRNGVYTWAIGDDGSTVSEITKAARIGQKDIVIVSYQPSLSTNEQKIRVNQSLSQTNCTADVNTYGYGPLQIGRRWQYASDSATERFFYGNVHEVVLWATALSDTDAAAAETNTMSEFSIASL